MADNDRVGVIVMPGYPAMDGRTVEHDSVIYTFMSWPDYNYGTHHPTGRSCRILPTRVELRFVQFPYYQEMGFWIPRHQQNPDQYVWSNLTTVYQAQQSEAKL